MQHHNHNLRMTIYRETREEALAKEIEYAPRKDHGVVLSQEQKELDFDEQVLSVIGKDDYLLQDAIIKCSENLVSKTEAAITDNAQPTHVDMLLRISFWEEITNAIHENRNFSERAVYNGVCSHSYWKTLRDSNEDKFTYILIPVKSYARTNKLLLALGQQKLIEILSADPFIKGQGSGHRRMLDPKVAKVQLEAYKLVEERIYGKAVQRVQQHNINESKPSEESTVTIDQLKKEIAELEGKTVIQIEADKVE